MKTLIVLICIGFAIAAYCASMTFNFNFNKSRNFLYWLSDTFFKIVGNILTMIAALVIFMGGASSYISHSIQNAFNGLDSIDTSLVGDTIKQVEKADTIDLPQAVKPTKVADKKEDKVVEDKKEKVAETKTDKKPFYVKLTCYNPKPEQCQGNPLQTASTDMIDLNKLKRGELHWCAVSRDLKDKLPFGTIVNIDGFGNHVVKDLMGPGIYNGIDILQDENKPQFMHKRVKIIIVSLPS
jgi:3D (Asp-Asp-Asp) domain-containing protein